MPVIFFNGSEIQASPGASLLDSLVTNGFEIPYGCKSGFCQSCMMVSRDKPCSGSQEGLKDTQKASGHFLSCQCLPSEDMHVSLPDAGEMFHTAIVKENSLLTDSIAKIVLTKTVDFHPGQFINIYHEKITRSYSIASQPEDGYMELHVKKYPEGKVSPWLFTLKPGEEITFNGPAGNCFYTPGENKLLLAGTGTGLSPLYAILNDAIKQNHGNEIHLVIGAVDLENLYYHEELLALEKKHSGFFYHPCVLSGTDPEGKIQQMSVIDLAKSITVNPGEWSCYFAGNGELVNSMKKSFFLAGVSMNNIYSDPFS